MVIRVEALVCVPVVGLRVLHFPRSNFIGVDKDIVPFEPRTESLQPLIGIVGADTGSVAVVPVVHAANEVLALNVAVGKQGSAM